MNTTRLQREHARLLKPKSLPYVFVEDPPSWDHANALNALGAEVCTHGRCPCFVWCGVERVRGVWRPLTAERRAEWFGRVYGLMVREK